MPPAILCDSIVVIFDASPIDTPHMSYKEKLDPKLGKLNLKAKH